MSSSLLPRFLWVSVRPRNPSKCLSLVASSSGLTQVNYRHANYITLHVYSGINGCLTPMYIAEISPRQIRGAVGTVFQLVLVIAILMSALLGLPACLGTETLWPVLLGKVS